jgi:uncharacterized protein (DUF58 family)
MKGVRILVGILFVVGLAGTLITGEAAYSRLLYISVFIVLLAFTLTRVGGTGLTVARRARIQKANVGDIFEEHFDVTNNGRFTALWVEVRNHTNLPHAAGSRLLTRVGAHQTLTYLARAWLTRRGRFSLGPTALTTGDPLGLFRATRTFPAETSVVALPAIFQIESFPHLPGLPQGGRVISRRALDITPHASNVREYVAGDPLKRIHWPTTARRGQLMVKEFDLDPQTEIWLFLDIQSRIHVEKKGVEPPLEMDPEGWLFGRRPKFRLPPSTLEYAISITASLAHYYIQQKRSVGLVAAGRAYTVIPAERSERQESKILETLAYLDADGYTSLAGVTAMQAPQLPSGSGVVLITPSARKELLASVDDLQRRHLRPVVILLMAESFGGHTPGSESLVRALTERGVPVCPIYCDADLSQALAAFAKTAPTQEFRPQWQSQYTPST